MKKLGMLLMFLSLCLFTVGCQQDETTTPPAGNGDAGAPMDTPTDEGVDTAPDTTEKPATPDETTK